MALRVALLVLLLTLLAVAANLLDAHAQACTDCQVPDETSMLQHMMGTQSHSQLLQENERLREEIARLKQSMLQQEEENTQLKLSLKTSPSGAASACTIIYGDALPASNNPFSCLTLSGTGWSDRGDQTWYGTYWEADAKCVANDECEYLHDFSGDGQNWRACRAVTTPGDGRAIVKKRSTVPVQYYLVAEDCSLEYGKLADASECGVAAMRLGFAFQQHYFRTTVDNPEGCFVCTNSRRGCDEGTVWYNPGPGVESWGGALPEETSRVCRQRSVPSWAQQ